MKTGKQLNESPLSNYILFLKSKGVDTSKLHWIPDRNCKVNFRPELKKVLENEGILIPGYEIRKVCRAATCLNPMHYRIIPSLNQVPDPVEVEELVDLIDIEVCENLGFERYLILFNEDNPLPARREDMRAAVSIALSRAKKSIPLEDVFWKGE
mgnify:CR=1 FL=1|jgi:hypothetical protein